jgi:choline dehydrogenase-like flavoprotein
VSYLEPSRRQRLKQLEGGSVQVIKSPVIHDAIVVGSGAGGGMAAMVLAKAGAKVLMLEAGDWYDTVKDSLMMMWPYQAPLRGASTPIKPFGYFDANIGGWQVDGEPYTSAPGSEFRWWRGRMLGGRTNHWGRISLRFGPYDFKPYSRDGLGTDWPISYEDLAPYYDKTEAFIGVFGSKENLENEPDGVFQPPPPPRLYERVIQRACGKLNIPCVPSRLSILTRALNGRAACHYCGQCGRACTTASNFSSPTVLIPPAVKTGNLKITCNAMVREVLTNDEGRATGVSYVDTKTGQEVTERARVVVLAASTCETARLLLNSKSPRFPNGLANGSGQVGRNLTDTVGASLSGYFPALADVPRHNEDGVGGMHLYMPWWNYQKKLDFPRGYHIEFGGGRGLPGAGIFGGSHRFLGGGYGADLKKKLRSMYGCFIGFSGRGEGIPNNDCYCDIDPNTVDKFGIPVLRFHWKWSRHEILMAKHMQETFREIIETAGGQVVGGPQRDYGIRAGGEIIHEAGTARMGNDPRTSVLNAWCQAHEVPNLFVTDGAPFPSNAHKNLTLTILALAWRTSEHIAELMKKGGL